MAKFKFKITDSTTLDDIENELERLKQLQINEIPFPYIKKILDFLDVEFLPNKGGSAIRFKHKYLVSNPNYLHGIFTVHKLHGRKNIVISKYDFKKYLLPPIKLIIYKIKEVDGGKN